MYFNDLTLLGVLLIAGWIKPHVTHYVFCQDYELGCELLRVISLIAEMCRPDAESTNHAAATIINYMKNIIRGRLIYCHNTIVMRCMLSMVANS